MALCIFYPTSCQKKNPKPSVDLLTRSHLTLRWRQINASTKFYLVFEETFAQSLLIERTFCEQAEQPSSINRWNTQHSHRTHRCDLQQKRKKSSLGGNFETWEYRLPSQMLTYLFLDHWSQLYRKKTLLTNIWSLESKIMNTQNIIYTGA